MPTYTVPDNPDLLTFAETAARLGVGGLTVREWFARTGRCPVVRDGRSGELTAVRHGSPNWRTSS